MAELISEPRLLPLRIATGRHQNRVSQRTLGQLPVQHRDDLPIPDSIEPSRVPGHAGSQLPLCFGDEPGGEHLIHAGPEPTVEDLTRHGQVNVPRPKRSMFTGHALPPRQRVSRQKGDLDRSSGTLPATAEKRLVEPACPPRQVGALE